MRSAPCCTHPRQTRASQHRLCCSTHWLVNCQTPHPSTLLAASPQVRAIRDRHERSISVFELLVGDLVVVETGDILPVDGVLVEGPGLK